ncbi:hypothetical protein D042_4043 [Vibrio parahaemolyticus NIHCB0757]|nr:hypothetical protein D042_4043 [Vibrio parahaemolyticus NIHCB0757]
MPNSITPLSNTASCLVKEKEANGTIGFQEMTCPKLTAIPYST